MADISSITLPDGSSYDIKDATARNSIPTKTSDLTNDSGFITGMEILSYGNSTWADFLAAYTAKKVVYCRASSNANPATGSQTRLAFMAYVNNADAPTNVEFQYYRSMSSHSATQQGDQTYVYKLDKTAGWTVTVRENYTRIAVNTGGLSGTWSSGTYTIANTKTTAASVGAIPAPSGPTSGDILKYDGTSWTASDDLPIASDTVPMSSDLVGSAGASEEYARADHVHPISTDLVTSFELEFKTSTSDTDPYAGDTLPADPTDEDLDELWSSIAPTISGSDYLWQRSRVTYVNAEILRGTPSCISSITERVEVATNLSNLSNEYYLSTSQTELIGGAWSDSVPALSPGHYIWTRIKMETVDGSSSYSVPTVHDALNSIANILSENNAVIEGQISGLSDDISAVESSVSGINEWIETGAITKPGGASAQGVKIQKTDGSTPYATVFTANTAEIYENTDKIAEVANKKVNASALRSNSVELTTSPFGGSASDWRVGSSASGFTIKWIGG